MHNRPEETIFEAALELNSEEKRSAYLDLACGGNSELRRRIEEMLKAHARADKFFEATTVADLAVSSGKDRTDVVAPEGPGTVIGRFKLLQQIGEGGMGVVYMAEQTEPVTRKVALKIIKAGMDTKQVIARFEAERQALALMDHPNIAKVLDAGATESGRSYFVMELIRGVPITAYCDKNHLRPKERLRLFISVCEAIQHAHQKGVIHRDIKPSNVLVTLHDGKPLPVVIDFGIAKAINQKLTEKTLFTNFAQMIGTPAYMSPEQAEMSKLDVDTRTDVYSLGVLLYELLTGTTPFPEKRLRSLGYGEIQRVIAEEEPQKPSTRVSTMEGEELTAVARNRQTDSLTLKKLFRGDLDWIVLKSLEKDRTLRYETVNGLRMDVERHLEDQAVSAAAPSAAYQFRKFIKRNKVFVAASAAIAAILVLATLASTWQMLRANRAAASERIALGEATRERDRARQAQAMAIQEKRSARLSAYAAQINVAQKLLDSGNVSQAHASLGRLRPGTGDEDFRGFEWRYLWQRSAGEDTLQLIEPVFSGPIRWLPDGNRIVAAVCNRHVRVWQVDPPAPLRILTQLGITLEAAVACSRDGSFVASSAMLRDVIELHDPATGSLLRTLEIPGALSLDISPLQGMLVAGTRSGAVVIVDAKTGREVYRWQVSTNSPVGARVSRNGDWIATYPYSIDRVGEIGIWQRRSGRWEIYDTLALDSFLATGAAFSPSEDLVAIGVSHQIRLYEPATRTTRPPVVRQGIASSNIDFSPDGKYFATGCYSGDVLIYSTETGKLHRELRGHNSPVTSVAFCPDGERLASFAEDETIRIWNWRDHPVEPKPIQLTSPIEALEFLPGGRVLVVSETEGISYLDLQTSQIQRSQRSHPPLAVRRDLWTTPFTRGGTIEAVLTKNGEPYFWNLETERPLARPRLPESTRLLSLDERGERLAILDSAATLNSPTAFQVWSMDPKFAATPMTPSIPFGAYVGSYTLTFAQDPRYLVGTWWGMIHVWEISTGKLLVKTLDTNGVLTTATVAPSGAFVGGTADGRVGFFEIPSAKRLRLIEVGPNPVLDLAFSSDGRSFVCGQLDGRVTLWNVEIGQRLLVLGEDADMVRCVNCSPDGQWIVAGYHSGRIRKWRAPSFEEIDSGERKKTVRPSDP